MIHVRGRLNTHASSDRSSLPNGACRASRRTARYVPSRSSTALLPACRPARLGQPREQFLKVGPLPASPRAPATSARTSVSTTTGADVPARSTSRPSSTARTPILLSRNASTPSLRSGVVHQQGRVAGFQQRRRVRLGRPRFPCAARRRACRWPPLRTAGATTRRTVVPAACRSRDDLADLPGARRVESVGRLVEHHQVARHQQRGRQAEPLLHAQRVAPVLAAARVGEADPAPARRRPHR